MKRVYVITALCLLSQQIIKANTLPGDSTIKNKAVANASKPPVNSAIAIVAAELFPGAQAVKPVSPFAEKLNAIQKEVQLDYNEYVQSYIDVYTRHKDEMSHVLGLSKYYFPIYEKIFTQAGIPEEIKYLSIVESKLDPFAVSKVGATGPWQFMPATAKSYGLIMDNYIDERRDPIKACYAAAAYLKDAYIEFGDWLLAIASYNCGKSNVERAIERSGTLDFWTLRQYLPAETRNYVPAYIAMSYVMNYAHEHNITAKHTSILGSTDTVMVDKHITLSNVAKALGMELKDIALFNPHYKKQVINGTTERPKRLIIPKTFDVDYAVLYTALNDPNATIATQPKRVMPVVVPASTSISTNYVKPGSVVTVEAPSQVAPSNTNVHVVKRGEDLVFVASTYGVDIEDLRKWNHLRGYSLTPGSKIKLTADAVVETTGNAGKNI